MLRKKLKHSKDKKVFKRTAATTKKINVNPGMVMRGGIRL